MPTILVDLRISTEEFLAHYQGKAKQVIAVDRSGKSVAFPSNILQPYVTHNGVSGTFAIEIDANNWFRGIRRV